MKAEEENQRMAAKLSRAKLLQSVEEAEVLHAVALKEAEAKAAVANEATDRFRRAQNVLREARTALVDALDSMT